MTEGPSAPATSSDFIRDMIRADVAAKKHGGQVVTRFPPEPNGYLHIGHAKAICLDFGAAKEFGGRCHLRMDDTNPTKEDVEYVEAIKRDVRWLGFDWGEHMYYASDYYERFYALAEKLVTLGRAYVCDLSDDDFSRHHRGTITEAGKESPYRNRTAEENLDLLRRMRKGEFKEGEKVLRAKIDMTSPNMKMRDPPLLRIKHAHHYRTGDTWCIYPLYDFAHCLSDSFEGVTHSLCTMEFESARELYDWVIRATEVPHVPEQTEFARLNLTYTVMSKRRLLQLVEMKYVRGWDDPRMPTLAGLRRRGYTPEAIREFCAKIGIAKNLSTVDMALLEHTVRDDLDARSPRVMAVLKPLRVVIETFPQGEVEEIDAPYWPKGTTPAANAKQGSRKVPFSRVIYVDRDDFNEHPPKGYFRLAPGRDVRLRHAYIVTCTGVVKDERGEIIEIICSHDPTTRGGVAPKGKKVEGTIQWVSAEHAKEAEVRLYDRLLGSESSNDEDWLTDLNPSSLTTVQAKVEPSLATASLGEHYQFERLGFFFTDPDSTPDLPVFNRTVALKDSWHKAVHTEVPKTEKPKSGEKTRSPKSDVTKGEAELSDSAKAMVAAHGITAAEARAVDQAPALEPLLASAIAAAPPATKKAVVSLIVNDVLGEMRSRRVDAVPFDGKALVALALLVESGEISTKQGKEVLGEMFASGKDPKDIVTARGMKQIASADSIAPFVDAVLAENADAVVRYRAGNANVFGALVGLVLKKSKGQANPKLVNELLKQRLG